MSRSGRARELRVRMRAVVAALVTLTSTMVVTAATVAAPHPTGAASPRDEASVAAVPAAAVSSGHGVRLLAGGVVRVRATAVGGQSIVGNLTITGARGGGFATVYPCVEGLPEPLTSNINFTGERDVANAFVVKADASGDICVWTSADAHVLIDQVGESSSVVPHNAIRRADSRSSGTPVNPGAPLTVHVSDAGGVAIVGNVTVSQPRGDGYATVYPCLEGLPPTSNVNFVQGTDAAAAFVVRADAGGNVCVASSVVADVIVDVAAETNALAPHNGVRLADSRTLGVKAGPDGVLRVHASSVGGQTVVGTVTVTNASASGFATVYGCGDGIPSTSNVNFTRAHDIANLFVTRTDANGNLCVYSSVETDLLIDSVAESNAIAAHQAVRQLDTRAGFVHLYDGYSEEGQVVFVVETSTANYWYQKVGAGFSSIVDPLGVDWVGFRPCCGASGEYRGTPSLGNCCHPGYPTANEGVPMITAVVENTSSQVVIKSVSADGTYEVSWRFRPTYATLTISKIPVNYWMVYEGTPGGSLGSEDYWVRSDRAVQNIYSYQGAAFAKDLPDPEWVYFADRNVKRSFFFAHHEADTIPDEYWTPGDMTVFGFSRQGNAPSFQATLPQHLSLGIVATENFDDVASRVADAYVGG